MALLDEEIKYSKKQHSKINVALIDIDLLTLINYIYGHQTTDEYLFKIATIIKDTLTVNRAFIGRTSGDEFTIIFLDADIDEVINDCTKIQKAIADGNLPNGSVDGILDLHKSTYEKFCGRKFVTVSIGILSKIPSKDETYESFMKQLDEVLYTGKKKGYSSIEVCNN